MLNALAKKRALLSHAHSCMEEVRKRFALELEQAERDLKIQQNDFDTLLTAVLGSSNS